MSYTELLDRMRAVVPRLPPGAAAFADQIEAALTARLASFDVDLNNPAQVDAALAAVVFAVEIIAGWHPDTLPAPSPPAMLGGLLNGLLSRKDQLAKEAR